MLYARQIDEEPSLAQQTAEFRRKQEQAAAKNNTTSELEQMMGLFRDRIKARGARGIIGLQRIFKIMDDDNSKTLSLVEFSKACRDFRIGISEEYIPTIFNAFDLNNDGTLSIDEFIFAVRGEMNEQRTQIVTQAFNKLDKDGSGAINLLDIRDLYRADKHPDVI
jgi:hypothetical protein